MQLPKIPNFCRVFAALITFSFSNYFEPAVEILLKFQRFKHWTVVACIRFFRYQRVVIRANQTDALNVFCSQVLIAATE